MFLCMTEPRDVRHPPDPTLPWVDSTSETRAPSQKNEKTRNQKVRQKENSHQSPILFLQKCLQIYRMSKENLQTDQSENCRLRKIAKCAKNKSDATFINGTRISPPLVLPADHILPQFSQTNFLSKHHEQRNKMPAVRRAYTRAYQPASTPYDSPPTNIYHLQAAILDDIQGISAFTETHQASQIDTSTLLRAIRLLVQCDIALETTETGIQIALPGTKFQYYRPVFKDFEDVLQRLKTRLLSLTNVSDELRQMALNQLDDSVPPPPPESESPPLSPSSPEYSPVYWSPSTDENEDYPNTNDDTSDIRVLRH
jgi:hypothetical protein